MMKPGINVISLAVNICLSSQFYCIKAALPYLRGSNKKMHL